MNDTLKALILRLVTVAPATARELEAETAHTYAAIRSNLASLTDVDKAIDCDPAGYFRKGGR